MKRWTEFFMMRLMRFGFISSLLLFSFIFVAGHEVYANEADYVWIENVDGTVTITYYNDPIRFNNHVMVPEQLGGKIVSAIGDFAFYDGYIVGVTLPDTITSIGNEAFAKNSVLRDVILPSGLVRIGDYAFRNNQISNINLPDSIKHIGFAAFSYNSLTSVLLPNGITSIGQFSFANNQIAAVSIPDSMTRIDQYAFTNNKLTAVTLPKSVIKVDNHAFSVNPQLSEVTIYSSATDLSSVSFPDNGPQLTIYGHASSPAQYLAQNKGYLFEPFKNSVVYDGNGHIGGNVPVDNNMYVRLQQATVLGNTGLLERLGYRFSGWNSAADGSGDDYAVNSKVTIGEEDVVLFAKWVPDDAKAPTITHASTVEDTQSTGGLVITPNASETGMVTHYWITAIVGGTLYKGNGMTQIANGEFITVHEGAAGLKFTPDADANSMDGSVFTFQVQASYDHNGAGLSLPAHASITVTEVNDPPVAVDDTLTIVAKGASKVIIAFADLFMNDSTGPANESLQSLTIIDVENAIGGTVAIVNGHIEFDLDPTFVGTAKFSYKVQDDGTTNGIDDFKTAGATVSFEVIEVIDEVKPNITLKGDNPVYLLLGEPYNEPGYTAYDDTDKDVTAGVTVQGSVDTQTLGSYELVYQVADLSGNEADEIIRIVHVVSNDLENLTAGTSGLQPAFDPAIMSYSMQVPYSVNVLHVAASLLDLSATLMIDGEAKGNNESKSVSLREGNNNITILVTAQGGATKMYTINVARASAPSYNGGSVESLPLLSDNAHIVELQVWGGGEKLQLNPSFASYISKYTIQTEAEQIEMLIELAHPKAKVMWNDRVITDKVKIELKEGENTFVFTVQAEDGTKKEYTLTVHSTTTLLEQPQASVRSYTDIAGHWAEDYIQRASAKGIVRGYPNGMFKPNSPITRAEFTVMLVATLNPKGQNATLVFADHEQIGEWAKKAVARAVQAGIVYGYSDGSFRPKAQITRAEMALMIARALKQQLDDNVTTSFADDEEIPGWAKSAVEVIRKLGIVDGRSGNYFVPNESATRAEAVVMLVRMLLR